MTLDSTTRAYVAGCGGMLGQAVHALLAKMCIVRATDIDANESWLELADIRDHALMAAEIEGFRPDVIINLAALTDLEVCERDPDNAWATNALGAVFLGQLARDRGIPYVYISTAGIFDGSQDFYTEEDLPVPLSTYGKSKHHAEMSIARSVPQHLVLRAGWMMGGGPRKDKKFINKIYKQIVAGATELRVVDDKLGTPTYTHDFARGLVSLLERGQSGLFNQVGGGHGSRHDVAVEFVRLLGLAGAVRIVQVGSEEFAREYFAPRPRSEQLINRRLDTLGLNVMRDWKECLAEYALEYVADLEARGGRVQRADEALDATTASSSRLPR
jgi:dTDP-4-dehydrorhamnose reductase